MISLERIWRLTVKEFAQSLRDRKMRFFLFLPPLIQLILFSYVASMDVKDVRTAWLDMDNSAESRELSRAIEASGHFTITDRPASPAEMRSLLDRGEVSIAFNIERGFSRDLARGVPASVQVTADGTDSNSATIALGYAQRILDSYSTSRNAATMRVRKRIEDGVRVRVWYNPELRSRNFFVPGVIASIIMVSCLILTSMAMVKEREAGTMEQLMVTPIRPVELILGKTVPYAVIGFIDMILVTVIGVFWFDVPVKGSVAFLFGATTLYLLCVLGIGLFISTISRTQQQALMATSFVYMPGLLLSGFIFPIENMPRGFQYVTYINPVTYFLRIIRGVFLKGIGIDMLWKEMLAILAIGLVIGAVSVARLTKRSA